MEFAFDSGDSALFIATTGRVIHAPDDMMPDVRVERRLEDELEPQIVLPRAVFVDVLHARRADGSWDDPTVFGVNVPAWHDTEPAVFATVMALALLRVKAAKVEAAWREMAAKAIAWLAEHDCRDPELLIATAVTQL